jgi:predicted nucleotidyltransferase
MPVRSLRSSVLKWPDAVAVDRAVREWAGRVAAKDPAVRRIGYFGSYARGTWGVGSDVDLLVVVRQSAEPFHRRALSYPADSLPVPADVLVYTEEEWRGLRREGSRLATEEPITWVVPDGATAHTPDR